MPDWVGHPIASVRKAAEELGIQLDVGEEPSDATRGTVIAQDPAAGTALSSPAKAAVTVSAGREATEERTVVVPVVVGMQLDEARVSAKKAGLGLKVRTRASGRPEQEVLEQSPVGGTRVTVPAMLDVVVAAAEEEPATLVVPDLVGQTPAAAEKVLKTMGLLLEVQAVTAAGAGGRVVRQIPVAGVVVDVGATVVVEVPRDRPVRPGRRNFVRDLTRLAAEDARLERLGLSADDLARRLRGAGIDSRDELKSALALTNEEFAKRLELRGRAEARTIISILKKAGAALDEPD
jgi:beta-lactam-binding protein with PASTA domain